MTQRSDEGVGGHRGLPGLWAALVFVGLAAWSMQTGSVEGQSGIINTTFTTSTSSHTTIVACPPFTGGETPQTVTTTLAIGPQTILIGVEGSQSFFVPAGSQNFNTNTHTETLVCDAVGIPTLSEWAQIGMAALLLGGGLLALRKQSAARGRSG